MQFPFFWETPFRLQLCFPQVFAELEQQAADPSGDHYHRAKHLLDDLAHYPDWKDGITDIARLESNQTLVHRLFEGYFPPGLTHNEIKAVSIPYTGITFNHTERFKKILRDAGPDFDINIRDFNEHQYYVMNCCLILNEFYGTRFDFTRPLFYDIPTASGTTRHYRILYNADFLEIYPTEQTVPLTPEDINLLMDNYDNVNLWKEKFPAESYLLKGFALMSLFDATTENAVSRFKEQLLGLQTQSLQESIESIMASIFRLRDIHIGFTIYQEEEDRFSNDAFGQRIRSFVLQPGTQNRSNQLFCHLSYRELLERKQYFAVSDVQEFARKYPESPLARNLSEQQVQSIILAPIVKDKRLFGVLELASNRPRELNSINANKLDVVMPFLTDTIERMVAEFQNQVEALIQDQYTTIHRSVYWKFRKEAKRFIYNQQLVSPVAPAEIVFSNVFPLYGQVDIKGSSDVRNHSVQLDLQQQLTALYALLKTLQEEPADMSYEPEMKTVHAMIEDMQHPIRAGTEQEVHSFLETTIYPLLKQVDNAGLQPIISRYFKDADRSTGSFYTHIRNFETTIGLINERLANILDQRQTEAQLIFPHYYERFKTDGVEHNLYIGQSISPKHAFDERHLQSIRFWQLHVLCEMVQAHERKRASLPYPLEVTALVMIMNATIDIRFRMDEKRFDVDGGYNARFEIVKKRIDKARIRHSAERITHAGKLTIVFSSESDENEYRSYITLLQDEGLLQKKVERFEIEELQGVSGLQALRIAIVNPVVS